MIIRRVTLNNQAVLKIYVRANGNADDILGGLHPVAFTFPSGSYTLIKQ
jgi:hypothetical protein